MQRRDKLLMLALENKENDCRDEKTNPCQPVFHTLTQVEPLQISVENNKNPRSLSNSSSSSSSSSSPSSSSSSSSIGSHISGSIKSMEFNYSTHHLRKPVENVPSTSNMRSSMVQETFPLPLPRPRSLSSCSSISRFSTVSSRAGDFSPDDDDADYVPPPNRAIHRESSSSERAINVPAPVVSPTKKKRKGVVNNKKKIAKELRNSGKQYVSLSKTKRVISARRMGPPCTERCRLRCSEKIDEDQRNAIFNLYWEMGCITRQRDFICKHLTIITPKYSYKRENNNRKPKHGFHLTVRENKVRVCKIFFKNTLGINDRPIRTVLEKMCNSGIVESEKRGKHGNQRKVLDEVVQTIKHHIESIPRIESHYLRQQTSREFIDGGKNLMDLYMDYKQMCQKEGKPAGEQHTYRKIFKQDYNISFFIPKKDMCEFCAAFENMDVLKKEENELKYLEHHTEKEFSRVEKNEDKLKVQENYIVACYDLQAVLPLPMCKTSAFYYKSKLNVCNFTICELNKDKCNCYVWSEVDSLRGANEIGSCVLDFIKEKAQTVNNSNLEIVFYSDNCCGQQKNQFMFSMYMYALANFKIKSITHKFLISGHTQNENDNVHSVIEKQVKKFLKSSPIYVPEQYITLIKTAKKRGNQYNVKGMLYSDFFDLKHLAYECGTQFTKDTGGDTVRLSEIKVIKFVKDNHGEVKVLFKNSFTENHWFEIAQNRQSRSRRNANRMGFPLKQLNNTKLELSTRKKNDLKSLIDSNLIPRYYAELFYNGIL